MKKRILFVDDEPLVLEGLKRLLHPMRAEWDMAFVGDGSSALKHLEREHCDVVVTDMRMPGMNGAELLAEVMKRHPATVRLVLSGFADQDLVLKCVGSTHQYLSKPCDPEALKATIARASSVEGALHHERLQKLVSRLPRLPSVPALYMEIVEKASQANASLEDVAATIGRDTAMTAQILKLANSAFFGLGRQLASAEAAVAYIGLDTIKSLTLCLHAFSQYAGAEAGELDIEALWTHSLHVASRAKIIAQAQAADTKTADAAFTAGLLHDVGKLILAVNLPKEYDGVGRHARTEGVEVQVAEQRVFGATHADVGGYLIGLWGLSVPVWEAVTFHHKPMRATQIIFSPLTCVHAANVIENENAALDGRGRAPEFDTSYLTRLGLLSRVSAWRDARGAD